MSSHETPVDDDTTSKEKRSHSEDTEEDPSEKKFNPLRCPFTPRTEVMKQNLSRSSKRSQRYRSTAQSRLGDMTVGDIRYCFQQLRNAGDNLTPEMILYNGQTAGEFALQYLQETSNATKKRRKNTNSSKEKETTSQNLHTQMNFPPNQLMDSEYEKKHKKKNNVLEF